MKKNPRPVRKTVNLTLVSGGNSRYMRVYIRDELDGHVASTNLTKKNAFRIARLLLAFAAEEYE
jgi:hypothetical protein